MASDVKALKKPKSTASNWYERIQKAKAARKQGIQAQTSQGKRHPTPRWYE